MKDVDPEFLEASRAVFTSSAPPSLEDIRKRVAAGAVGTTRRDMLSALNRVEDLFGRPLSATPANAKTVRELLRSKSGPQLGVSTKAYANICSGVRAALAEVMVHRIGSPQRVGKVEQVISQLGVVVLFKDRMGL